MSDNSIWKEVEELFTDADKIRHDTSTRRWRDADPDSEEVMHQLRAVLGAAVDNADTWRNSIRERNRRIRSFGYGLPEGREELLIEANKVVDYLRDALDKTNRQLSAITSSAALGDALDIQMQRHDWRNLLQSIGGYLSTWKLKNLHDFVNEHAKTLEQDVVNLMMVQDPDKKNTITALISKALNIDETLRTIQNISAMTPSEINKACPDLSRAQPTPSLAILRNQCFEDRIQYLLETRKHMDALKEMVQAAAEETPKARGGVRQKIRGKVKLMDKIIAGKLSQRSRRPGTKYSTTTLSPIATRALSTILFELTLLEPTTRSPMEMERLTIAWSGHGGVVPVLRRLSKLDLPVNIRGQLEVLQDAIQDRVRKAKKGGSRTRRRRRSRDRHRTRHKRRRSSRRKSRRRRRKRRKRYTRR